MGSASLTWTVVGNQLLILLISFTKATQPVAERWESVTNPLDKLSALPTPFTRQVGNQLLILLISFPVDLSRQDARWESVTNPLDKLSFATLGIAFLLGISY